MFVAGLAAGLVLHLDTPPARALVRWVVDDALRGWLRGSVEVEGIDLMGLQGLEIGSVVARDPEGELVLRMTSVRATFDALSIARGLLGGGEIGVTVPLVRIERADVVMDRWSGGPSEGTANAEPRTTLRIADALSPGPETEWPWRPPRLAFQRIEIGSAWIHGEPAPGHAVDATASELIASATITPALSRIEIDRAEIVERRLLLGIAAAAPGGGAAPANGAPPPFLVDPSIVLRLDGHLEVGVGRPIEATAALSGSVAGIALAARGSIHRGEIDASAEIPRLDPTVARAICPDLPLERPVSITVQAGGALPHLDVAAQILVLDPIGAAGPPGGEIALHGWIGLREALRGAVDVRTRRLDPRAFVIMAPAGSVDADARLLVEGARIYGSGSIDEPGAPIDVQLDASGGELRIEASSRIPSLAAVPRLPRGLNGRATVRVAGAVRGGALEARMEAHLSDLRLGRDLGLTRGLFSAELHGPLAVLAASGGEQARRALRVDASLRGERLVVFGRAFDLLALHAGGSTGALRVTSTLSGATGRVAATAVVDAEGEEVRGVRVGIERGPLRIEGRIMRATRRLSGVDLVGLTLEGEGAGRIEGALSVRRAAIEGELRGRDLDLARLSELAGLPVQLSGLASIDAELRGPPGRREGHLMIELEDGELPGLAQRVSMNVTARARGSDLEVDGLVRLMLPAGASPSPCDGAVASLLLQRARASLGGDLIEARAWRELAGSAELTAESRELGCLTDARIGGHLRGRIVLGGRIDAPEVHARAAVANVSSAGRALPVRAEASLHLTPPRGASPATAEARVAVLAAPHGGRIEARARSRLAWRPGAFPALVEDPGAYITVSADRFRLGSIAPLVPDSVRRLNGVVDGEVRLGNGPRVSSTGRLRLRDGAVEIPVLGQELRGARFDVVGGSGGELRIEALRAAARRGEIAGAAAVRMRGLTFGGARAELSVAGGEALPFMIRGVPAGEVRGEVTLSAERSGGALALDVAVPSLQLTLPTPPRRDAVAAEAVAAEVPPPPAGHGAPVLVTVRLGDVRLEGSKVEARLTGDPARPLRLAVAGPGLTSASGDVRIVSGRLDVLGRELTLEPSLIRLCPEHPTNPYVRATANWEAPDGTLVHIDYTGALLPVADDKLRFRSEPPRSPRDVLSLLLFGD